MDPARSPTLTLTLTTRPSPLRARAPLPAFSQSPLLSACLYHAALALDLQPDVDQGVRNKRVRRRGEVCEEVCECVWGGEGSLFRKQGESLPQHHPLTSLSSRAMIAACSDTLPIDAMERAFAD